jgi:signal transduction histidine kinase/ActR/RegA family two-component response regulator
MPEHGEPPASRGDTLRPVAAGLPDWPTLFRRTTADGALRDIASWIGNEDDLDLLLEIPGPSGPETVRYRGAAVTGSASSGPSEAVVRGRPAWKLSAWCRGSEAIPQLRIDWAAWVLSAWRTARLEQGRADARVQSRAKDLDILQAMSRRGAEAQSPQDLFATVATVLHEGAGIDLLAVAHSLGGGREVTSYLGRPVAEGDIDSIATELAEALGWSKEPALDIECALLPGFERTAEKRGEFHSEEVVQAPLVRRGKTIGAVAIAPSEPLGERGLRLCYSASNQLSLHLDRILTVRDAEKGRFRSILDSMPQAVLLADRGLHVIQANLSAENLLPKLAPHRGDGPLQQVGDLDLRPLASDAFEGRVPTAVGEARLDGGSVLTITVSALRSDADHTEGLVIVLTDVTEARRIQEYLAQAEKLSSLGQLISGIAHELNNPLATVLGYSQLVRGWTDDEKLGKRLETIHEEARRCQRIVQNLLRFTRHRAPERIPLSLNEAAEAVLNLMAYQLRVDRIQVVRELDRDLPSVLGDPHELQQAILNLLTNAHQAIQTSRGEGTIRLRTSSPAPGRVLLEVEDDGPGIPDEIRSRIFDPFFTTKAPGQGTGLGLSLVYGTVTSHGGSIRVQAREGGGTVFGLELPRGAPPTGPAPTMPREEIGSRPSARILVVDDEEPFAKLICEALTADGHHAEPAGDGENALRRLSEEDFDLVVSDLRMPGNGAARLQKEMELLRPGLSKRLLLTTGDIATRDADLLAAEMGTAVLHKPFDLDDLRRAVRSQLVRQREH